MNILTEVEADLTSTIAPLIYISVIQIEIQRKNEEKGIQPLIQDNLLNYRRGRRVRTRTI